VKIEKTFEIDSSSRVALKHIPAIAD